MFYGSDVHAQSAAALFKPHADRLLPSAPKQLEAPLGPFTVPAV